MKGFDPTTTPLCEQMAIGFVGRLGALRFFPSDPAAREPIVDLLMQMCETEFQAAWLVRRMTSGIYNEWPGLQEMRACYCSRFKPKDGLEQHSSVFPENSFPPDPTAPKQIEAPQFKQIASGEVVTEDPELVEGSRKLMVSTAMPNSALSQQERQRAARFSKLLETTLTPPNERTEPKAELPTPQIITQADIDRALTERAAKAKR